MVERLPSIAMTVFRKLRPLSYLSSYSHRGKYYTLAEIARFDQLGLWSHHGAHFSRHGTLLNTCAVLVGDGEAGYTSDELEHLLQVQVKDPLRNLTRQGRIRRTKVAGRWVHFATDSTVRSAQVRARHVWESQPTGLGAGGRVVPDELQAAIVLFCSLSTNASAACTPASRPSSSAMAATAGSLICSVSTPVP